MQIVQISKTKLESFYTLLTANSRRAASVEHLYPLCNSLSSELQGKNTYRDSTMTWTHIVKQQVQRADESTIAVLHWDCSSWPLRQTIKIWAYIMFWWVWLDIFFEYLIFEFWNLQCLSRWKKRNLHWISSFSIWHEKGCGISHVNSSGITCSYCALS